MIDRNKWDMIEALNRILYREGYEDGWQQVGEHRGRTYSKKSVYWIGHADGIGDRELMDNDPKPEDHWVN
jgi:hypothetical protein